MKFKSRTIGLKISKYRILNGLSQEALARKCNITQAYVGKLESSDNKTPSMETLGLIAKNLNVSIDDLIADLLAINKNISFKNELFYKINDELSMMTVENLNKLDGIITLLHQHGKVKL